MQVPKHAVLKITTEKSRFCAEITNTNNLQVCFTNPKFVVQICSKNAISLKTVLFLKGNSFFTTNLDYKFLIREVHLKITTVFFMKRTN